MTIPNKQTDRPSPMKAGVSVPLKQIAREYHSMWGLGEVIWEKGDIVTRDGTDEHEILDIWYDYMLIDVKCITEPKIYPGQDEPWIKLGEEESNLIRRYLLVRKAH